jgi:hypothetical protein
LIDSADASGKRWVSTADVDREACHHAKVTIVTSASEADGIYSAC